MEREDVLIWDRRREQHDMTYEDEDVRHDSHTVPWQRLPRVLVDKILEDLIE